MKIKKITSMLMVAITTFSVMPQVVYATDTNIELNKQNYYNNKTYIPVWGQVSNITEDGRILIKNSTNVNNEILLNVSEDTIIVDAVTGAPIVAKDIKLNEDIYTYVGQAMTLSLPPMTNAKVIVANMPQGFKTPNYVKVESVKKNNDGSITITSDDGNYEANITKDTKLFPYLTKNLVIIDNIEVGSNLLLWEEANLNGDLPSKINILKCMIAPNEEENNDIGEKQKDGWNKVDNNWYYFKDNDSCKGWLKENDKWYYLDNNGVMKTGWMKYNNSWYYLNEDGSMKTGWLLNNKKYYYLKSSGEMAYNEQVDGYYLGHNGVWVK